jgi:hypothetical protein
MWGNAKACLESSTVADLTRLQQLDNALFGAQKATATGYKCQGAGGGTIMEVWSLVVRVVPSCILWSFRFLLTGVSGSHTDQQ